MCAEEPRFPRMLICITWEKGFHVGMIYGNTGLTTINPLSLLQDCSGPFTGWHSDFPKGDGDHKLAWPWGTISKNQSSEGFLFLSFFTSWVKKSLGAEDLEAQIRRMQYHFCCLSFPQIWETVAARVQVWGVQHEGLMSVYCGMLTTVGPANIWLLIQIQVLKKQKEKMSPWDESS